MIEQLFFNALESLIWVAIFHAIVRRSGNKKGEKDGQSIVVVGYQEMEKEKKDRRRMIEIVNRTLEEKDQKRRP